MIEEQYLRLGNIIVELYQALSLQKFLRPVHALSEADANEIEQDAVILHAPSWQERIIPITRALTLAADAAGSQAVVSRIFRTFFQATAASVGFSSA